MSTKAQKEVKQLYLYQCQTIVTLYQYHEYGHGEKDPCESGHDKNGDREKDGNH